MSENGAGTLVQYQVEKTPANVWKDIGTIRNNYVALYPNNTINDFNMMRFRVRGNSTGTPIVFNGFEILVLSDEGFDQN